jgi:transposase
MNRVSVQRKPPGVWNRQLVAMNIRSGDVDQLLLMPPSIRDWLPADHLVFFILDVVEELDLNDFIIAYRTDGRGGALYDPKLMLAVLLYAYCTGERSSRAIEKKLVEDVPYRVVAANQNPDHSTLARFRRRHEAAIAELFGQVLRLCVKADLVQLGIVAIDGTKFGADASFFANRKRESLEKELSKDPDAAAHQILAEAEATDAAEDAEYGPTGAPQMPANWSGGSDRRARIREALKELDSQRSTDYETRLAEREKKEAALGKKLTGPKPSAQTARRSGPRRANTTDPHSRIIAQANKGVLQGYNAQAAASTGHIVLAAEVAATTNDQPHFQPMTAAVKRNLAQAGHQGTIEAFVADAGYWTAENGSVDVGADVLIATRKGSWRPTTPPDDDKLAVLARVNRGELSQRKAGAILGVSYTWVRDMTKRYFGRDGSRLTPHAEPEPEQWIPVIQRHARGEISQRAAADELAVTPGRVKTMLAHVNGQAVDPSIARKTMDDKLSQAENEQRYKQRSTTIEPVFGNIKHNLKYRRFTLRGLPAVHSEWRLICTAHNLLKLHTAATI